MNSPDVLVRLVHIEKLNGPFLFGDKGTPAEYSAGLKLAIERGWLKMHEPLSPSRRPAPGLERIDRLYSTLRMRIT